MGTTDVDLVAAREYGTCPILSDGAEVAGVEGELNLCGCSWKQGDTLEATQLADGGVRTGGGEIEFGDFISFELAGVGYGGIDG